MIDKILLGTVYSTFDNKLGPDYIAWEPEDLDNDIRLAASVKSLNLLSGSKSAVPKTLEIITFPTLNLKGMIKFIELEDNSEKGKYSQNAITLLFKEEYDIIFYKYIKNFEEIFQDIADQIKYYEQTGKSTKLITLKLKEFRESVKKILIELYNAEYSTRGQMPFPKPLQEGKGKYRTFRFKVIVCGDPRVGKTTSILRFTDNVFRNTYIMTMGVNISSKNIIMDDQRIKFATWDIAGQAKFELRRKHFYEGADGYFIIFDLTRPETLESVPKWYNDIKKHLTGNANGYLIGNKIDLVDQIKVSKNSIKEVASKLDLQYIETSAKTGQNINEAFERLAKMLIKPR